MMRCFILILIGLAMIYSIMATVLFGSDIFGLSTLAKALFACFVTITVFQWWRKRVKTASKRRSAVSAELPQVLNEISQYLKSAENGVSQVGNPPAVVVLKSVRSANEALARAYKIVRDGSPESLQDHKALFAEIMVPEDEVKSFLRGKNSLDDISGIERYISPSREALGRLRFNAGW